MESAIDSVLYGPSIEFRNEEWVKCGLLLWDSIYRIVPSSCTPHDGPAVKLARDAGLVRNIRLEPEDLRLTYSDFQGFLEGLPFLPAGLESEGTDRVHAEKIDSRLYPALEAMAVRADPDGFLRLPTALARGYMMYLAKAVSERRNLATATDDLDEWSIMPYFKEDANFSEYLYNRDAQAFYSFVIFKDILPQLESVDAKAVIDFAATRRDEKAQLREVLQKFSTSIGLCTSPSHAADLIADYETQMKQAKDEFKKSMGFYDEEQGHSLLTLGLPLAATVYGCFGGSDPFNLLRISSAICVGAIAAYADYNKVKNRKREQSYASYLVEIERDLKGESRAPIADRIFEEFVND